jgi:REP element-mobilizing transposase RayT
MTEAISRQSRKRDTQHGGKRKGAGRKPKHGRAGSPHGKRPEITSQQPVHIVMRVVPAVGSLRRRAIYKAIRDATITAALRERFQIVHVSVQRNHVHMLVEAETQQALARGMQGFEISAARNINTMLGSRRQRRSGQVFADRYYAKVIRSPRQAHHTLRYVLCNWRRHNEDQRGLANTWLIDPFSTGILFPDWKELQHKDVMWPIRATYDPLVVFRPKSWLLREAWKRHGAISARDVPGAAH